MQYVGICVNICESDGTFVLFFRVCSISQEAPPSMLLVSIVSECSMNVAFSYKTIYGNFGVENMKTRHSTTPELHVASLV